MRNFSSIMVTKINEIIKIPNLKRNQQKNRNQVTPPLPPHSLSPLRFNVNNSDKYTMFKITSATLLARARPRIAKTIHSSRSSKKKNPQELCTRMN